MSICLEKGAYSYGTTVVFEQKLSLEFSMDGQVIVWQGSNGVGKSSVFRHLYRKYRATYLPEVFEFPGHLMASQILEYFGGGAQSSEIDSLKKKLAVPEKIFRELSKGNRQKLRVLVTLCRGVSMESELILLDEPTSGLDKKAQSDFWEGIDGIASMLAEKTKIFVITHETDDPYLLKKEEEGWGVVRFDKDGWRLSA